MANLKLVATFVCAFITIIVAMIITLLVFSLKKLSSDQIGLVYDTINKELDTEAKTEGLHMGPPGFEFIIFPNVYKTLSFDRLQCLNADGVIISLDVTYQYKAQAPKLHDIVMNFKDYEEYKRVLKYTGKVNPQYMNLAAILPPRSSRQRGTFQEQLRDKIEEKYVFLYCSITDLQVSDISRPMEYELALRSKERAREDIQVASNERPRLITEAETEKREANTTAEIILDKANSDARILKARAAAEAEAIIQQYEKESEAYEQILSSSDLGFTMDGFISYLGVRVISSAANPVYIGLQSPAKSSYQAP